MSKNQRNIATIFDRLNEDLNDATSTGLSNQKLKEFVIRDLLFLLNTPSYYYQTDETETKEYTESVINYGITPISGCRVSEIDWIQVEQNIEYAIKIFEPRILKESLEVKCVFETETKAKYNQMNIEIKGLIKATPFPERFVLFTHLDVETGSFKAAN